MCVDGDKENIHNTNSVLSMWGKSVLMYELGEISLNDIQLNDTSFLLLEWKSLFYVDSMISA